MNERQMIKKLFETALNPTEAQSEKMFRKILSQYQDEKKGLYFAMKNLRPVFKGAIALATAAAVICLCIFGGIFNNGGLLSTQTANAFTLTAYAAEQQSDGSVTAGSQLGFTDNGFLILDFPDDVTGKIGGSGIFSENGELLGTTLYTGFGVQFEGENIISATLLVDKGHFGAIKTDNYTYWHTERLDEVIIDDIGGINLFLWEMDFMEDIWATQGNTARSRLEIIEGLQFGNVTITAVVTFADGEVQQKSIIFDPQSVWDKVLSQPQGQPGIERNPDGTIG